MPEIVFWGATGQAKVLHEAILGRDMRLVALIDNRDIASPIADVPMLVAEAGLRQWLAERQSDESLHYAVAIGGSRGRDRLQIMRSLDSLGLLPYTVIHDTAFVARDATVGQSCQVLAHANLCSHAVLGDAVIVNTAASIDHDTKIGDGVHIAPGAVLTGEVVVGAGAFIGAGAVILPRLEIGAEAIVGAGAVVTKNIPPGVTVVGNPARELQPTRHGNG